MKHLTQLLEDCY